MEGIEFEGPKGTIFIRPEDHVAMQDMYIATLLNVDDPEFKYFEYVRYLLPWATQNYLLHHSVPYVLLGAGACFGYAAVFLGVGYRHFAKRDL